MPTVQIVVVKNGVVVGTRDPNEPLSWIAQYVSDTAVNYFESDTFVSFFQVQDVTAVREESYENEILQFSAPIGELRPRTSVPDPRIAMNTANAKTAAISNITLYHNYRILNTYSLQRQTDINALAYNPATGSAWTSQNKTDMATFINTELTAIRTKTTAINALADTAAVLAYAGYYS